MRSPDLFDEYRPYNMDENDYTAADLALPFDRLRAFRN